MRDETLVVLAEYNTLMEAEITKSILDSAGIESTIRNEYMSPLYPVAPCPARSSYANRTWSGRSRC